MSIPHRLIALLALLLCSTGLTVGLCAEPGIADRPAVKSFIQDMARRHHYDRAALERIFRQTVIQPKILEAISKPYEAKPWYAYRKIFLTDTRIQGGLSFWNKHSAALARASARYGVAPEMIVAIIGIETNYGGNAGSYRVIDALATLTFDFPKRAQFFRRELEEFLLLCREEGMDPLRPQGSYAGAMGMPQFMPSSYREYAADADGDHKRDIWDNPADAIASVGNYFSVHGWRRGEPVAFPAQFKGKRAAGLGSKSLKPGRSIAELKTLGVHSQTTLPGRTPANLLTLEEESGPGYWLTLHNFYVISRYNHSPLYAMAAHQLSQELVNRHHAASPASLRR